MTEMYAEYLKELGAKSMYCTEKGFAIYSFVGENCYLEDLYVKPDFRGTSHATELADAIADIGRKKGCKLLLGSIVTTNKQSTNNMKIFLHYGMNIAEASQNFVLLSKEL